MAVGGPFRELGRFLDECDRGERTVTGVELAEGGDTDGDAPIAALVELSIPAPVTDPGGGVPSLCSPRLDSEGTLRFALESTRGLVPTADFDVGVDVCEATVTRSGEVTARLAVTPRTSDDSIDPEPTSPKSVGAESPPSSERPGQDRGVPPFRDPDLLASVYESCDTFAEMADAIDMDVTAETVRRYMIDFDIHQPDTYRTDGASADVEADADGSGADSPEPVVLSDGIGLPEDVTVDALIDTVRRSNTIYEVTRAIDLDREAALETLEDLNLLDLVVGRLATEGERDISREEVVSRLREAPGTQ